MVNVVKYEDELVSADACHGIHVARTHSKTLGHHFKQAIPGMVAEFIVDPLETIQVQKHNGKLLLVAPGPRNSLIQTVIEQGPVGKIGEHIEIRQLRDLLLCRPAPGNIPDDAEKHLLPIQFDNPGIDLHRHGRTIPAQVCRFENRTAFLDFIEPLRNLGGKFGRVKPGDVHPDHLVPGITEPLVTGAVDVPDDPVQIKD